MQRTLVNQYLRHNLGDKQKIQVIRRNPVYFSSSNVQSLSRTRCSENFVRVRQ